MAVGGLVVPVCFPCGGRPSGPASPSAAFFGAAYRFFPKSLLRRVPLCLRPDGVVSLVAGSNVRSLQRRVRAGHATGTCHFFVSKASRTVCGGAFRPSERNL